MSEFPCMVPGVAKIFGRKNLGMEQPEHQSEQCVTDLHEECRRQFDKLRAKYSAELQAQDRMVERLVKQNELLTNRLIELAMKPPPPPPPIPEPINVPDIVREVGEALAKSLVGYGMQQPEVKVTTNPLDPQTMYQPADPQQFIPDHEVDDNLFPGIYQNEVLPTRGGWYNANTPPPVDMDHLPNHQIVNGTLMRADGTPMFQPGATSPPPTGGTE